METYKVNDFQVNMRLDKILVSFMPEKSRTYISKLIDKKPVENSDFVSKIDYSLINKNIIDIYQEIIK